MSALTREEASDQSGQVLDEMGEETPLEFTVTDELYQISEATNSDGTVDVEVYDFNKKDRGDQSQVEVLFRTPTGDKKSETMEWPRKDSADYKFVRVCRNTVGGLNGAEWLKTDGARIKADPDNWEIKADLSRKRQAIDHAKGWTLFKTFRAAVTLVIVAWFTALAVFIVGAPIVGILTTAGIIGAVEGLGSAWLGVLVLSMASILTLMPIIMALWPAPEE